MYNIFDAIKATTFFFSLQVVVTKNGVHVLLVTLILFCDYPSDVDANPQLSLFFIQLRYEFQILLLNQHADNVVQDLRIQAAPRHPNFVQFFSYYQILLHMFELTVILVQMFTMESIPTMGVFAYHYIILKFQ